MMRLFARRARRFAVGAMTSSAFFAVAIVGAAATVLPAKVLDAALPTAIGLHRQTIPTTIKLPYYRLGASSAAGFIDRDAFDYGYLANGADVLMVPLDSGGSGGVFTTLLFTSLHSKPVYVGPVNSAAGHLDVHLQGGRIVVITPIYGKNDPNCCPSAHRFVRYTLRAGKLVKLDEQRSP